MEIAKTTIDIATKSVTGGVASQKGGGSGFLEVLKNQATETVQNLKGVDKAILEQIKGNLPAEEVIPIVSTAVLEAKGTAEIIRSGADTVNKVINITV